MIKTWMRTGFVALGVDRLVRAVCGGDGAILMLHQVAKAAFTGWCGNPGLVLPVAMLEQMIGALRREGYELLTLSSALDRLDHPEPPRRRFACLTFDDGSRDAFDILLPALERLETPATVFLTSGFLDRTVLMWWAVLEAALARLPFADPAARSAAWADLTTRLSLASADQQSALLTPLCARAGLDAAAVHDASVLTWDQARRLAASGLVELGAHTVSHPVLASLGDTEALAEMQGSRERIQTMTGAAADTFAYPFGALDSINASSPLLARQAGFRAAVLGCGGVARRPADSWRLPRIGLGGHDNIKALRRRLTGLTR